MSDDLIPPNGRPTASRPLLGLTVLVVEDSRYASEALRLLCLRSGARIRRADCLRSARRHLAAYRPSVAIIDLGLPDGSGEELIADLKTGPAQLPVVLATSGDDGAAARGLAAGADGFLAKPVASLAVFQQAILSRLADPERARLRSLPDDTIIPDPIALRDDLIHATEVLQADAGQAAMDYAAQFLHGLALAAGDEGLGRAADQLARHQGDALPRVNRQLQARISAVAPV